MTTRPEPLHLETWGDQVVSVWQGGTRLRVSPLERALLGELARHAPDLIPRQDLAERVGVDLDTLYRLVYRLRGRLGSESLDQVGSSTTRGGRSYGLSGYRLTLPVRLGPLADQTSTA